MAKTEIFAYFEHRVTNAYTESLNNIARLTNCIGRGYSFEAIRAKMLFNGGLHIEHRPSHSLKQENSTIFKMMHEVSIQPDYDSEPRNYGVPFSTLQAMLEADSK